MSKEPTNTVDRDKARLAILKEQKLSPEYYLKKSVFSALVGVLVAAGVHNITGSANLPFWVATASGLIAASIFFGVSHLKQLKEIKKDVKQWDEWANPQ